MDNTSVTDAEATASSANDMSPSGSRNLRSTLTPSASVPSALNMEVDKDASKRKSTSQKDATVSKQPKKLLIIDDVNVTPDKEIQVQIKRLPCVVKWLNEMYKHGQVDIALKDTAIIDERTSQLDDSRRQMSFLQGRYDQLDAKHKETLSDYTALRQPRTEDGSYREIPPPGYTSGSHIAEVTGSASAVPQKQPLVTASPYDTASWDDLKSIINFLSDQLDNNIRLQQKTTQEIRATTQ